MKTYETERLIIKPTNTEDAKFIFEIMNTPKYHKYIGDRNIKSLEDAENYIKNRMLLQYEKISESSGNPAWGGSGTACRIPDLSVRQLPPDSGQPGT